MKSYCIDTCAILERGPDRSYALDIFASLWQRIDALIEGGRIFSCAEVYRELTARLNEEDEACQWAKKNRTIFLPLVSEVQLACREILKHFPKMFDHRTGKSAADPWVVATAKVKSLCVITQEKRSTSPGGYKLPDICERIGVECLNIQGLMRKEGWTL